jgi:hypothetical protein
MLRPRMPDKQNWHSDARSGHRARSDIYWWTGGLKKDPKKLQQLITDFEVMTTDNQRNESYVTYASLYTNRRIDPGAPLLQNYQVAWYLGKGKYTRCPYNLMKVVIDEATSRITKSHPYAKFMTFGGNRTAQRKAEMMERWNGGEIGRLRQEEMFDAVLKDACQYGLGSLKHRKAYRENRLTTNRVYPGNLFVDLEETLFGPATRLHERRPVSKTALSTMFPKFKNEIEDSDRVSDASQYAEWFGDYQGAKDQVELIESWHLPSFLENGKSPDGVRVLWIQRAILQIDVYNRREFPFSFFNWKPDPHNSFYGIGLGEDLMGVHIDANVTINRINTAIEKMPNPYLLAKKGTHINKAAATNEPGSIYEWSGNEKPEWLLPNVVPGDLLRYVQEHELRAYRIAGLSSAAQTGGGLPQSLQTGRAVENYFAAESIPFNEQLRKFENFVKHVAENNIAVGREIYEQDPTYSVVLPGDKNTIQQVSWKDIALDPAEESYVIRVAPTSALSETPSARLAEVERMVAMGMISDPATMRQLYNITDLEQDEDYASATLRNIKRMLELAIDENIYTPPVPSMDNNLFVIMATMEEQKAYDYNVPEANISTLRRMRRKAQENVQRQQQAALIQAQGMIQPTMPAQRPETGVSPTAIQSTPGR